MFLRCQSQWGRFSRLVPTNLLSCFLPDSPVQLGHPPLPCQLLLERQCTPGTARLALFGAQSQQPQVGHPGYRHRTLHPGGILRHLRLAQAYDTLEFLDAECHRPASEREGHGQGRGRGR